MPIINKGIFDTGDVFLRQTGNDWPTAQVLSTSDITEAASNLYYTNARVNSFIQGNLSTKANVTDLTTANVVENTNLYYTNARVYSNVIALLPTLAGQNIVIEANGRVSANVDTSTLQTNFSILSAQVISLSNQTTSNVAEGSNLYYTNARVYSNVIALLPTLAGSGIQIQANGQISADAQSVSLAGLSTTNLAEGSNLYYTNSRVRTAFTAGKGISILGDGTIKSTAAGGEYNINLSGAAAYTVSNVMTGITFTGSASDRFIIRSIQVTNISEGNLAYVSSNVLYSNGNTAYLGNLISVPSGGFVEFIDRTQIIQAGDSLYMQGFDNNFTPTSNILSAYITYETILGDTSYVGVGQTLSNINSNISLVTSDTADFIIESVKFVNLKQINIPIKLYFANATTSVPKAYLAYNMQIPGGSSLEILQSPKVLKTNDVLYASYTNSSNADSISVFTSYRKSEQTTVSFTTPSVSASNTAIITFNTSVPEGTVLYYTIE